MGTYKSLLEILEACKPDYWAFLHAPAETLFVYEGTYPLVLALPPVSVGAILQGNARISIDFECSIAFMVQDEQDSVGIAENETNFVQTDLIDEAHTGAVRFLECLIENESVYEVSNIRINPIPRYSQTNVLAGVDLNFTIRIDPNNIC